MASCYNSHDYGVAGGFTDASEVKAALDAGGLAHVPLGPRPRLALVVSSVSDGSSRQLSVETCRHAARSSACARATATF